MRRREDEGGHGHFGTFNSRQQAGRIGPIAYRPNKHPMSTKVLIVDDHAAIAQALASAFILAGFEAAEHVPGEALTIQGVLEVTRRFQPDVALVDLNLGRGRSGLSMIGPLVGAGVPVVAITARDDALAPAEAIEAGALGFLHKAEPFPTVVAYVEQVLQGETVISPSRRYELENLARAHRGDDRLQRFDRLSEREREVLRSLIEGRNAAEIAAMSHVSVRTVRKQIEAVRSKLAVNSQLAAVALAREVGWRHEGGRSEP
jgi:DNA-binding NarL/FixJ family response regulator